MTFQPKVVEGGLQFTDEEIEAAAVMHYDHHYGPGGFRTLAPRAQRRLIYRMRTALATLPRMERP
jgi:hypothetical protein